MEKKKIKNIHLPTQLLLLLLPSFSSITGLLLSNYSIIGIFKFDKLNLTSLACSTKISPFQFEYRDVLNFKEINYWPSLQKYHCFNLFSTFKSKHAKTLHVHTAHYPNFISAALSRVFPKRDLSPLFALSIG